MEHLTSVLIGIGLAMDAFTVSLGIGTGKQANYNRAKFRLIFHFGLFQAAMTVLGWYAGNTVAHYIREFDHWIAMALLGYVGMNMIRSGVNPEADSYISDPSKGKILIMLSIATSIDAMAVGLSMAMLDQPWLVPVMIIGIVTWGLCTIGLLIGDKLGKKFGKRMEIFGGLILIGIGLRVLITHVFFGVG
jgi:putative Mn2+ efflux pump MntP